MKLPRYTLFILGSAGILGSVALTCFKSSETVQPASVMVKGPLPAQPTSIVCKSVLESTSQEQEEEPASPWTRLEAEALKGWKTRFMHLQQSSPSRQEAEEKLVAILDSEYLPWLQEQLVGISAQDLPERYDTLAELEEALIEGAGTLLAELEFDLTTYGAGLKQTLELLEAEQSYAEVADESETRLAMLRLDRERDERQFALFAQGSDSENGDLEAEIDAWYGNALGQILGLDEGEDSDLVE